jgi:putative copper export protein
MRDISFDIDSIRTLLHLLAVAVWVGGQIVMLGLLPALRKLGGDAPREVAAAFGKVTWPFFALAVVTGIWNFMWALSEFDSLSSSYNMVFGIKFLAVIATGVAAFMHQQATTPKMRGITGGIGFMAALAAMILGVALAH